VPAVNSEELRESFDELEGLLKLAEDATASLDRAEERLFNARTIMGALSVVGLALLFFGISFVSGLKVSDPTDILPAIITLLIAVPASIFYFMQRHQRLVLVVATERRIHRRVVLMVDNYFNYLERREISPVRLETYVVRAMRLDRGFGGRSKRSPE
jgi:hypothetical protein